MPIAVPSWPIRPPRNRNPFNTVWGDGTDRVAESMRLAAEPAQ